MFIGEHLNIKLNTGSILVTHDLDQYFHKTDINASKIRV